MYAQYWNLGSRPFENDCNADFFYRSRTHQAAILKLRYLLESNKGAGLLVGGTGYGKTYLTKMLVSELAEPFTPVVWVHYPFLNSAELMGYLAAHLSGDDTEAARDDLSLDRILSQLQSALGWHASEGRHPLIVIDDAHLIEDQRVFQTLQLILNLRVETPFTLLLCGQRSLLARTEQMPELNERLGVKSLIQSFNRDETAGYIRHRLQVAGLKQPVFDEAALTEIHELAAGVPRRINRLADLALLVGYADGMKQLTVREIESVSEEIGQCVPA